MKSIVVRPAGFGVPSSYRHVDPEQTRIDNDVSLGAPLFNAASYVNFGALSGWEVRSFWHFDAPWTPRSGEKLLLPYSLVAAMQATLTLMDEDWDPDTLTWANQPAASGDTRTISIASGSADAIPSAGMQRETFGLPVSGRLCLRWVPAAGTYYGLRLAVTADEVDTARGDAVTGSFSAPFIVS